MLESTLHELTVVLRRIETRWPALMSREIAAEYCCIAPSTFDDWVRKGDLPRPLRGKKRWSKNSIDRALAVLDGTSSLTDADDDAAFLDNILKAQGHA
jgi:predicted DNA-binding transcriptional regulator AlpA